MNVLGKGILYINGFDGEEKGETRLSVSVSIVSKNMKDEWQTAFLPVMLSKSVKENLSIDEKSLKKLYEKDGKYGEDIKLKYNIKLEDNNAWLTSNVYKDKKGKQISQVLLFINDLTIVTNDDKPVEKRSRERR